jgi:S-DNA-T family DNA segregation ATPase FtsK/SpoIIIE
LRELGPRFGPYLVGNPTLLRRRPEPDVWSVLEYACHVRDVLVIQRERLQLALVEDCPTFTPMGRDDLVVSRRYNEQDPAVVAGELTAAGDVLAADFAALDDTRWRRTGIYNYPTPTERTMLWLGRHTVHEGCHHLDDVRRVAAIVND